ncbi:hypothetical protein [Prochlorococcus sp. MIT 1300]|uniref:hypothetical protein n=1 Tax=Prochlorococcus sp. MIT 1300 TaxID=3096218 RepID=UPI002A75B857|nr:hypothetical protein [Prochlorococcus sp. MIT 1300]
MTALLFSYPAIGCEWRSERSSDAVIRFHDTSMKASPEWKGTLFYKGNKVRSFSHGQYQGYATTWWSTPREDMVGKSTTGSVLLFVDKEPLRGHKNAKSVKGKKTVLIVGLGSSLWYGEKQYLRDDIDLLYAAEGFWRVSRDCPKIDRY